MVTHRCLQMNQGSFWCPLVENPPHLTAHPKCRRDVGLILPGITCSISPGQQHVETLSETFPESVCGVSLGSLRVQEFRVLLPATAQPPFLLRERKEGKRLISFTEVPKMVSRTLYVISVYPEVNLVFSLQS